MEVSEIGGGLVLGNHEMNEYGILVETALGTRKIEKTERYKHDVRCSRFGEFNWNKVAHDHIELRTF
jgi:hypothetical protein